MDLLRPDTVQVHSDQYRACPKAQVFQKAKIDMMLATNIFKLAHTKWAGLTVLASQIEQASPILRLQLRI